MKYLLTFIFLGISWSLFSQTSDSLETELKKTLSQRQKYVALKESDIRNIIRTRNLTTTSIQEYQINKKLAGKYAKFKVDSAAYYLEQNMILSTRLGREDLTQETATDLSLFYSLLGKFREAEIILNKIKINSLSTDQKSKYYSAYKTFLEYYSTDHYSVYAKQIENYRDLALHSMNKESVLYEIGISEKLLDENKVKEAEERLLTLFKRTSEKDSLYALIAYSLGNSPKGKNGSLNAKKYFTLSAIADTKNATKDNASLQKLATIYYSEGDLDMAYLLTKYAIEDAIFSNVKFRMFQVSKFNEEITGAYQEKQRKQHHRLIIYLILISILTLFLVISIVMIWKQKRKVEHIKNSLAGLNEELTLSNIQLAESNHIKEAYISNFFEWCSSYIDKIENYRKMLLKKAINKGSDDLINELKSTALEKQELENLYETFDSVFLQLYPNFISEFNALLIDGESVLPKPGELLSPQLRVFALIRLGIKDSSKIASFLRYSSSTVYNYRTKGRNMAAGNRDDFESSVMKIRGIY